ncbi:hypothetical protein Pst134EA_005533 [Puccinia striiformis f. sp. tritici]|uniref:hypothetical protein n=1 Tax=Puccinia striiformis f. sp. tritici TaxID=168172 RepID=UPI002007CC37|nr:hypothetical protein Pst134EA_005533 [Puccinia striiformis f. sp. tritici]KAH9471649.1 hypothetical protein Pst134EA_005533 [Puccinia striiformis f. sp. tritici]
MIIHLSQGPSPFSSAEHEEPLPLGPLQSTATTPSPSKAKQPAKKKGAQGKAGAKSKGGTYQITRAQKAKLKRDHRQGIRDMMDDQDSLPERATRRKTPKSAQASPKEDGGKHFVRANFENICTYLENAQHFTDLFGDGAKTTVSAGKVSKVKAFEVFAVWMNQLNPGLLLNGRQLQQRFTSYKAKYSAAKHREDGTGGGVEEKDGDKSLAEVMEDMCPCFARLDAIFREKANITPMFEFDHLLIDTTIEEDLSDASSEEILFEGWEPTQSQAPVPLAQSISPSDPAAAPNSQIDLDQLCPPLPDLADLLAGSANNLAPAPPSPARGPAPPLPASAPVTMLNPPLPAGPGSPMPQMLMVRQLSQGSRGGAPDPNARGTNAPDPKSKMSLASSFAQANERKFDILENQIATKTRRWKEAGARAERDRARGSERGQGSYDDATAFKLRGGSDATTRSTRSSADRGPHWPKNKGYVMTRKLWSTTCCKRATRQPRLRHWCVWSLDSHLFCDPLPRWHMSSNLFPVSSPSHRFFWFLVLSLALSSRLFLFLDSSHVVCLFSRDLLILTGAKSNSQFPLDSPLLFPFIIFIELKSFSCA